jgi:hypothetical protein
MTAPTNDGESLKKQFSSILDEFEKQLRIDISNHISGDKSRSCAITHFESRKSLMELFDAELTKARKREAKLLNALGLMYGQYCSGSMGHDFMSAGEAAIDILEDYGVHNEELEWTDKTYDKLDSVVATLNQKEQE